MSVRTIRSWVMAMLLGAAAVALPAAAEAAYPGVNGRIAYTSNGVWTMNPDGTGATRLTTTGGWPAWSPDGLRIAYIRTDSPCHCERIHVMDADGTDDSFLFETTATNGRASPTWSPDGQQLAFSSAGDIWTIPATGGTPTPVTQTPAREDRPSWSPSGAEIAFAVNRGIDAAAPDGTGRRTIVPPAPLPPPDEGQIDPVADDPDWSPSGDRLMYTFNETCPDDLLYTRGLIKTVRADGTGTTLIAGGCYAHQMHPSWSPDGTRFVAWGYGEADVFPIYTRGMPGSGFPYDETNVFGSTPDWQPIPINAYPRPKAASPQHLSLVPAYQQCTSGNRTHGPPLAFPSCAPPLREPGQLTVGTPDANGTPAKNVGELWIAVVLGNPSTPADEADVHIYGEVKDVRLASNLSDYTGSLEARVNLRITDKDNTPHPGGPGAATVEDLTYTFPIPCSVTADTTVGSHCPFDTTAEALLPGVAKERSRAIWELGQLSVHDAGGNVFLRQGVFVP